jgi:glycosyltransferase involved in cell wall biosynthesis
MQPGSARPRVLAILPGFFASTETLVVKPLLALHAAGVLTADITLEVVASAGQVRRADVVVFCRNLEPAFGHLFATARDLAKPVIYDIDDNFYEAPAGEEGRYYRDPGRLEQLTTYLAGASLVRVYSDGLYRRAASLGARVEKIVPPLYDCLLNGARPPDHSPPIRIVYATSRMYDELAQIFLVDLRRLLRRYRGSIEAHFWGFHPAELRGQPAVRFINLIRDYDRYLRRFYGNGYDIGLAPLQDDEFHRSKTDIKFREYGGCGVAGIYSNVEPYAASVRHEATGLLVSNEPGAWYEAMERLVADPGLRATIQAQAQRYVRQHYSYVRFREQWREQVFRLLGQAGPVGPNPPVAAGLAGGPATRAPRPRGSLSRRLRQAWSMAGRVRRRGLLAAWYSLGWYVSNLWTLLRIGLATRPRAGRLNQRAPIP